MSKYIIILTFISFFLVPPPVLGQEKSFQKLIRVTPIILNMTLEKGQEKVYEVKVDNLLTSPMGIRVNIESLNASDEETGMQFAIPQEKDSFSSKLQVSEDNFILQEKKSRTLKITVKTPQKIKDGGYQAVIFLTPFFNKPVEKLSPTVSSRIGILVLANVGKPKDVPAKQKAEIVEFGFKEVFEKGPADLILRVKNIFPFIISSKARVRVTSLFEKEKVIELGDKRILPGKIRKWQQEVKLSPGIYKATVELSLYQGQILYKDTYFALLPIKTTPFFVILALSLLLIFRKRLKKAILVLFSNKLKCSV